MHRRTALGLLGSGMVATLSLPAVSWAQSANEAAPEPAASEKLITIWRDPGCGCCDAYGRYLEQNGFTVTLVDDRDFAKRSVDVGVPQQGIGCHLSEIGGYYVSGLVPAEIIYRLLASRPAITGITLPGMPSNAPGMAAAKSGTLRTYAFGPDGISVYSDE